MDENKEFEIIDETLPDASQKIIVAYEDATIKDLKEQIKHLNTKIDRIHWINMIARAGYVLFNPSFHLQNASKDILYRTASFVMNRFM